MEKRAKINDEKLCDGFVYFEEMYVFVCVVVGGVSVQTYAQIQVRGVNGIR